MSALSTGCPNKFASEANYVYKENVFRLKKIAFWAFFRELQNESGFLKHFVLCCDLLEKLLQKAIFILQLTKKDRKAFFVNVTRFAR